MATLIHQPTQVEACGNKPKIIKEFIGLVNSNTADVSIAQMNSPQGWVEPGQSPDFDEYTVVLQGTLHVKTSDDEFDVKEGQAIIAHKREWVQYSTPDEGAQYVAICLPAFSIEAVRRDEEKV